MYLLRTADLSLFIFSHSATRGSFILSLSVLTTNASCPNQKAIYWHLQKSLHQKWSKSVPTIVIVIRYAFIKLWTQKHSWLV